MQQAENYTAIIFEILLEHKIKKNITHPFLEAVV